MTRPRISKRDWRNVALFAVGVMLLTTLPYLIGASTQNDQWRFSWFTFGLDDGNSYLAKMRQGAVDGWLFHIVYTSEPHEGAFLFTPYLAAGKIAALIAPPSSPAFVDAMLLVFHVSRIAFGVLLILVVYRFVAAFLVKRSLRWLALILICLGGGLGWLLTLLGLDPFLGSSPIDFYLPEGYTFYLLYGLPHLSLARAALLGGLILIFRADLTPRRAGYMRPLHQKGDINWLPYAVLAGLCWLVMGLCVPFYVAVLYAILGVWGLAVLIRHRRFPAGLFLRCTVGAAIPAPLLIYNFVVFSTNPIMGAWSRQNTLPSPHPLHYLLGYGVLAVLAIPAIRLAWQRGRRHTAYLLLPAWVIAGPVLAYVPVSVQRRLLEATFVPLCILATMGLRLWIIGLRQSSHRARTIWQRAVAVVFMLTLPTTFLLLISTSFAARLPGPNNRLFNNSAVMTALDWLNTNVPADSVVLSEIDIGNYLPARASLRAYIGHGPETINLEAKREQVRQLFAGEMDASERRALFEAHNIRYVIFPIGRHAPDWPDLKLIHDTCGYFCWCPKINCMDSIEPEEPYFPNSYAIYEVVGLHQ